MAGTSILGRSGVTAQGCGTGETGGGGSRPGGDGFGSKALEGGDGTRALDVAHSGLETRVDTS